MEIGLIRPETQARVMPKPVNHYPPNPACTRRNPVLTGNRRLVREQGGRERGKAEA